MDEVSDLGRLFHLQHLFLIGSRLVCGFQLLYTYFHIVIISDAQKIPMIDRRVHSSVHDTAIQYVHSGENLHKMPTCGGYIFKERK